jgi:hypothetical protein
MSNLIKRREALVAAGGLGAALVGGRELFGSPNALAADCMLQREVTEGPYYLDLDLVRRNIKEDRRGIQRTNTKGWVRFETIYPGWYRGRTPHIHMKVFVSGQEIHTGQVFMKDVISARVYSRGVYASRGQADTTNSEDSIYSAAGRRALLALRRKGDRIVDGYIGTLNIGVEPS